MRILSSPGIALAAIMVFAAQLSAKPNFTGVWELVPEKSDFGPLPSTPEMTLTIEHDEPQLVLVNSQPRSKNVLKYTAKYTTDGRECVNKVGEVDAKSIVKWDGEVLASTTRIEIGKSQLTTTSAWALSPDGKVLTMKTHFSTEQGEFDTVQVFNKKQ